MTTRYGGHVPRVALEAQLARPPGADAVTASKALQTVSLTVSSSSPLPRDTVARTNVMTVRVRDTAEPCDDERAATAAREQEATFARERPCGHLEFPDYGAAAANLARIDGATWAAAHAAATAAGGDRHGVRLCDVPDVLQRGLELAARAGETTHAAQLPATAAAASSALSALDAAAAAAATWAAAEAALATSRASRVTPWQVRAVAAHAEAELGRGSYARVPLVRCVVPRLLARPSTLRSASRCSRLPHTAPVYSNRTLLPCLTPVQRAPLPLDPFLRAVAAAAAELTASARLPDRSPTMTATSTSTAAARTAPAPPASTYALDYGDGTDGGGGDPRSRAVWHPTGGGLLPSGADLAVGTGRATRHARGYAGHVPAGMGAVVAAAAAGSTTTTAVGVGDDAAAQAVGAAPRPPRVTQQLRLRMPGFSGHVPSQGPPGAGAGQPTDPTVPNRGLITDAARADARVLEYWAARRGMP